MVGSTDNRRSSNAIFEDDLCSELPFMMYHLPLVASLAELSLDLLLFGRNDIEESDSVDSCSSESICLIVLVAISLILAFNCDVSISIFSFHIRVVSVGIPAILRYVNSGLKKYIKLKLCTGSLLRTVEQCYCMYNQLLTVITFLL